MKDDDEEEYVVNSAGVARYQCMPSEVALQQMRNRMQLAKLGKKLMKWTALASSREMRSLGQEIEAVYDELNDKLKDAYIMLARSRYFNPNLNNVVTENVDKSAAVLVETRLKTRSGVKVMQPEIIETNYDPYIYLGIEKGGEIIVEAKKQWHEIIRMLISIMQLRATFVMVEKASKTANKKKNVFARIIIPRTSETIAYIESGLEELAREDFFRLRRFIYKKRSSSPSYQERKPMEIKERLIPKVSKRIYRIECFMCGEFLRFSLVNEREKFMERRKVAELRFQMNEMLQIAKKLEEQGIMDISVDEFIVTAEKLKDKLNESPHIDQLCRTCKELLKRKHEKENSNQKEIQQTEQNIKTDPIVIKSEILVPANGTHKEETSKDEIIILDAPAQDLSLRQIEKDNESLKSLKIYKNESIMSHKIAKTFTEIDQDTEDDLTERKKISTITIMKELKSDLSVYNQTLLDSPLETSVEKITRVVTDEKEKKSFVEEKFIITIKEKIKNVIGKIKKHPQSSCTTSGNEKNNQSKHEIIQSTIIRIDSPLSLEQLTSQSKERDLVLNSSVTIVEEKSKEPTHLSTSTVSNNTIVKDVIPPPSIILSEVVLNNRNKFIKEQLKIESSKKTMPLNSMSFNDVAMSDKTIKYDFKRSASLPSLHLTADKPQERISQANLTNYLSNAAKSSEAEETRSTPCPCIITNKRHTEGTRLMISDDRPQQEAHTVNNVEEVSRNSSDSTILEVYKEKMHTINRKCCVNINEGNLIKGATSIGTVKDHLTEKKRVKENAVEHTKSLPTVGKSSDIIPQGSMSYAGICGVYIPPQNPTEVLSQPCICVSSTTLLSTELDSNRN